MRDGKLCVLQYMNLSIWKEMKDGKRIKTEALTDASYSLMVRESIRGKGVIRAVKI